MNTGGYTYVRYQENGKDVWAAGPETGDVAVGDDVVLTSGMLMKNFHANSIDRDFEEIWFVGCDPEGGSCAGRGGRSPCRHGHGQHDG